MNRLENRDQNIMGGPAATPPLGQRNNLQRGPRQGANTGPRNMPRQDSRAGPNRTSFNDDNGMFSILHSSITFKFLR